jgi:RNA polymerase sigma factor (sigma-70 family)
MRSEAFIEWPRDGPCGDPDKTHRHPVTTSRRLRLISYDFYWLVVMTEQTLNELAVLAQNGNLGAVEQLLAKCQHRVYAICRRMLGQPADAQDAAQEVLIKITTSLGSFRADSDFMTWAHRIAVNHVISLLRTDRSAERGFASMAKDLAAGLRYGANRTAPSADEQLLAYEVFVACAQGMLQCLEGSQRLALVLVDVCDMSHEEAAAILEVDPAALRQRVSRARRELSEFLGKQCGLVNPAAPCRCVKQVPASIAVGNISKEPSRANAGMQRTIATIESELQNLTELARATRLLKSLPELRAPEALVSAVRNVLNSDRYRSLH